MCPNINHPRVSMKKQRSFLQIKLLNFGAKVLGKSRGMRFTWPWLVPQTSSDTAHAQARKLNGHQNLTNKSGA